LALLERVVICGKKRTSGGGDVKRDFGRVMTAMITPFTESGEVAYDKAAELALHLVKTGSDSI
jgi:4-hydroxy-tetrahydrodipicolinate synthase